MVDPEELTTEEVLAVARERLMSLPEAARWLDARDPSQKFYTVKLHRLVEEGEIQAVRIGGEETKGFHLVDKKAVGRLLEDTEDGSGEETEDR